MIAAGSLPADLSLDHRKATLPLGATRSRKFVIIYITMSPKTKAIIIIASAIVIFGLLVAIIFDLFPSKEIAPDTSKQQEVVLPDKDEGLPEGATFDASNAQEFSDLNPAIFGEDDDSSPLEKEARDLAEFFIERFGTYSSDSRFSYIDDLRSFMSDSMAKEMDAYKKTASIPDSYFSVDSSIASIEKESFSLANRNAIFTVVLNREEEQAGSMSQYQQNASVYLTQDNTGHWKVNKVIWGQKI